MKNLRNFLVGIMVLALMMATQALAGMGHGAMDGTGPQMNIYAGESVSVSGVVADLPAPGAPGLKVDTGEGVVTVYGLGPSWFWERMGVAYPSVGEEITVNGYKVMLSDGTERIIATEMILSGETVKLRDEDGRPAWRGGRSGADNCSKCWRNQ